MSYGHEPGWYPDPWRQAGYRWWTGRTWTSDVTGRTDDDSPLVRQASARAAAAARVYGAAGTGPGYTPLRPPTPPTPPTPPLPPARLRAGAIVVLAGAALVVLGSLLPWVEFETSFGTQSIAGTERDGVLTILGALVVAGLTFGAVHGQAVRPLIGALAITGVIVLVVLVDLASFSNHIATARRQGLFSDTRVGPGVWIVLVGAATSLAGGLYALLPRPTT